MMWERIGPEELLAVLRSDVTENRDMTASIDVETLLVYALHDARRDFVEGVTRRVEGRPIASRVAHLIDWEPTLEEQAHAFEKLSGIILGIRAARYQMLERVED